MQTNRRIDTGALVLGVILLLVGGYFLLENAFGFDLPELDWDLIWPLALVGLGVLVMIRAFGGRSGSGQPPGQP